MAIPDKRTTEAEVVAELRDGEEAAAQDEQPDQRHRHRREAAEARREAVPVGRGALCERRQGADPEDDGGGVERHRRRRQPARAGHHYPGQSPDDGTSWHARFRRQHHQ